MMKSVAFLSLSLAALVGCGGDDPKKPVIVVDAPNNNTVDAPDQQGACTGPSVIPGGMGALPFTYTKDALADMGDPAGDQESWDTFLGANEDPKPDAFYIGFYEGPPPAYTTMDFPMNVSAQNPFTVTFDGPEGDATKCSVCIGMLTDIDQAAMDYADDYVAGSGMVTLTALSATKITGSITGVTLRHVDLDFMAGTQTDNASGCTTTLGDIMFDSVPEPAMAKNGQRGWRIKVQGIELPRIRAARLAAQQ